MNSVEKKRLIALIKEKKELRGLPDEYVEDHLKKFQISSNSPLRKRDEKVLIKEVRAALRKSVGQFYPKSSKNNDLTKHISTRERSESYEVVKKIIKESNARSIIDIGCGLNPLALATPDIMYYACDINTEHLAEVRTFFERNNIKGEVFVADFRKTTQFPKADLCLLFKVLDLMDTKGHKRAEEIISTLNCSLILASFSTKTISGKPMRHPQRGWIEQLLNRLGYTFSLIPTYNELFYYIQK